MKLKNLAACLSAICLGAVAGQAQQTNEIDQLKLQLQQMRETFEKVQREQRQQIDALTKKLEDLTKQQTAEAEKKKLEQELAVELQKGQPAAAPASAASAPSST